MNNKMVSTKKGISKEEFFLKAKKALGDWNKIKASELINNENSSRFYFSLYQYLDINKAETNNIIAANEMNWLISQKFISKSKERTFVFDLAKKTWIKKFQEKLLEAFYKRKGAIVVSGQTIKNHSTPIEIKFLSQHEWIEVHTTRFLISKSKI